MPFQMIDGDERLACCQRQGLGRAVAYQQGGNQAGARGGSEYVNVRRGDAGFPARGADDAGKVRGMVAGGQFRNHSAMLAVNGDLGGNDGGEDIRRFFLPGRTQHGDRRFIAGGFYSQDGESIRHGWGVGSGIRTPAVSGPVPCQ